MKAQPLPAFVRHPTLGPKPSNPTSPAQLPRVLREFRNQLEGPEVWVPPFVDRGLPVEIKGLALQAAPLHGVPAAPRVDLSLKAGERVAVVGHRHDGPSTFIHLLANLDAPTAGEILLGGKPLASQRSSIRVLFEDARLLPWLNVLDNVALGVPESIGRRRWAMSALEQAGGAHLASCRPTHLTTSDAQRVAFARAIAHPPGLLLMDNPFGLLDELSRQDLHRRLRAISDRDNHTLVFATNAPREALLVANRVVLIQRGQVVLDETLVGVAADHSEHPDRFDLEQLLRQRLRRGSAFGYA